MSPSQTYRPIFAQPTADVIIAILILIFASIFSLHVIFQQFGGYDLSPLIDLFWRIHNGQIPGKDFIYTFPPMIAVAAKLVAWKDMTWTDLTVLNIAFTVASFLLMLVSGWRASTNRWWWPCLAGIVSIPLIYCNHLWHSTLSQIAAIGSLYCLYLVLTVEKPAIRQLTGLFLFSALLALSKQNVALPVIGLSLLIVIIGGCKNSKTAALTILSAYIFGVFFYHYYVGTSLHDFVSSYTMVTGRLIPSSGMLDEMSMVVSNKALGILLILFLPFFCMEFFKTPLTPLRYLLALVAAAAALIPVLTDWDTKMNDAPFPLFLFGLALIGKVNCPPQKNSLASRLFYLLLACVLTAAIIEGWTRERMYHVGPGLFYESPTTETVDSGYFSGLKTGAHLKAVLDEIHQFVPQDSATPIFFGPRIEFGYALTNNTSPHGFPLWWHPGTSFALRDEELVIGLFKKQNFSTIIFLKNDRTRVPQPILDYIASHYTQIPGTTALDIYHPKDENRARATQ
jgi:hypothetical protein